MGAQMIVISIEYFFVSFIIFLGYTSLLSTMQLISYNKLTMDYIE